MLRAKCAYNVRHVVRVSCKCCAHLPATRDVTFGALCRNTYVCSQHNRILPLWTKASRPTWGTIVSFKSFHFEGVSSSVATAGGGRHIAEIAEVVVGTPTGGQGSKAADVASLVRVPRWFWWWTVLFESYWRLHSWPCDLIGHPVLPRALSTTNNSCLKTWGQQRLWLACTWGSSHWFGGDLSSGIWREACADRKRRAFGM
jgi:hypothetical protein